MTLSLDFHAVYNASPYPYLLIAKDHTILHANAAYLRATDRTLDELVGHNIFQAFPRNPDDPDSVNTEEVARSIDAAVATRKAHTSPLLRYAVPHDTIEGRVFEDRFWSATHTPVFDGQGEVALVSQNAIDVTDLYRFDASSRHYFLRKTPDAVPNGSEYSRPQLHEAMTRILSVERNQLETLFNQAPGFIAVLMGKDCVVETVNEAYYQLVGHRDLVGRPIMGAIPELADQGFGEIFAQVFATGRPVVLSEQRFATHRGSDGALEDRYVDLLYQPIFDADGRVIGIFSQGHDVTAGYAARRALAEKLEELAKARQRGAFQLQLADLLRPLDDADAIYRRSAELMAEQFDASRVLFGEYHRERRKFEFHSDYVDGREVPLPSPAMVELDPDDVEVFEDGGIWVSEDLTADPRTAGPETWPSFKELEVHTAIVVPLARKGPCISCLFLGSAVPRTWGAVELGVLREAAERVWIAIERVRAEEALRLADERKDQFLAMLAHELRNPLAPIRAAADIQAMAPTDAARVEATSAIIARQVKHMTSLVDDLLDVSRVTRGLVTLGTQDVDIKEVLSSALEQVRPMLEARGHHLSMQHAPGSTVVAGDEKRLVQIFANLLNNSVKYTPDGGRIQVDAEAVGDSVLVTVADNGIGMSPEVARSAFDLFVQGQRTPDRAQGGLGIGLALVKRLVELHSGTVYADSRGPGQGSTFRVRLPRLTKPRPQRRVKPAIPAMIAKPLRVLIVDDNQDAAAMLAMLLESLGHTAAIAYSAPDGLKRAFAEHPDVCLLDLGLPGMDGHALARELRRNASTASALLIAVTGYGQEEDRRQSAEAGFDHHLVKPVDAATLAALLATGDRLDSDEYPPSRLGMD